MSFRDVGRQRRQDIHNKFLRQSQPINEEELARKVPREHRGVRPRLVARCPVTSKNLIDEEDSIAESFFTSGGKSSVPEEDSIGPPVARSPVTSRSQSIFSTLTSEIVNFQKLVAELENLMESSGQSPKAQWRTRTLIRSAQEADRDIYKRLYEYDIEYHYSQYSKTQMAWRKLSRDFSRVQNQLKDIVATYEKRQQVDVSFLTSKEEKTEEFFDRAMRERELEVNNINKSMHQVDEIYKDLAGLVDGQQEQIDKIAEETEYARTQTRAGLEKLQESILEMCGLEPPEQDTTQRSESQEENIFNCISEADAALILKGMQQDALEIGLLLGCTPADFGFAEQREPKKYERFEEEKMPEREKYAWFEEEKLPERTKYDKLEEEKMLGPEIYTRFDGEKGSEAKIHRSIHTINLKKKPVQW